MRCTYGAVFRLLIEQTQACLCIRNVAARGPSLRQAMLDEGCESLIREAGKLRGCVDEAYGALRDLRCQVCDLS